MNGKKRDKATIFWAGIGVLVFLFLLFSQTFQKEQESTRLTIDYGNGTVRTFEAAPDSDTSAWDFLQQASAEHNIFLEVAPEFLPKSIGDKKNGEGGKWVWYKNGRRQEGSPERANLQAGEHIVFKFE